MYVIGRVHFRGTVTSLSDIPVGITDIPYTSNCTCLLWNYGHVIDSVIRRSAEVVLIDNQPHPEAIDNYGFHRRSRSIQLDCPFVSVMLILSRG